jgi:MOSC domain-containing protein YiiM
MAKGTIVQVSASRGGVPKRAILQGVVDATGITGDRQKNLEFHGGPDRAVCLFASERIEALAAEGHPIYPGATGENVTTRGVDWAAVVPGARLRLGDTVLLEITDFAQPCKKNRVWFSDGNFNRINQKRFPGWSRVYARVLVGGVIRRGDAVELIAAVPTAAPEPPHVHHLGPD